MRRILWAFAVTLCCLGSPAEAAGIQLLESDPALSGAIWYPCAAEPTHVALGSLSVGADFDMKAVKDAPSPAQDSRSSSSPTAGVDFSASNTTQRRRLPMPASNLAVVKVPFQFWRSQFGGPGVGDGSGTARVAEGLPGKPEIHVVPAGHFAFLAPCSAELAAAVPRICIDTPAGFDRAGLSPRVQCGVGAVLSSAARWRRTMSAR